MKMNMAIKTTYRNPWFKPNNGRQEFFAVYSKAVEYRGFQLYQNGRGFDVVKDGACVSQRATKNGAYGWIDILCNMKAKGFDYLPDKWLFLSVKGKTIEQYQAF